MIWTCWLNGPHDRWPVALTKEGDPRPTQNSQDNVDGHPVVVVHELHVGNRFKADSEDDARAQFVYWKKHGLPPDPYASSPGVVRESIRKIWRHRGAPHYLMAQSRRMALPDALIAKSKRCVELRELDRTMAHLSERYHQLRMRQAGIIEFSPPDKASAAKSLEHAEETVQSLHCIAAAAAQIVDEAWAAFGMQPPARSFQVLETPPPLVTVKTAQVPLVPVEHPAEEPEEKPVEPEQVPVSQPTMPTNSEPTQRHGHQPKHPKHGAK